jgi:hypothetical protein
MHLKRLLPLAAAFAATLALNAQTSVWKVSQGNRVLYLGGTSHLLRPADFPLPPEFDEAYAAASAVYFETDLKRVLSPEMQQVVMQRGMLADEQTLQSVVSTEAWQAIQVYCQTRGMPVAQVLKFRPWLFLTVISMVEIQKLGVTQAGVDLHFFQRATAERKAIGQLESFESQIDYITSMGAGHESEMILQSLEDLAELPEKVPQLLRGWRDGDMRVLDALMHDEMRTKHPAIYASLLVERNNHWLGVLERLIASPEVELVLVGVGHMAGPDGLLAQLRGRGYEVEQVRAGGR